MTATDFLDAPAAAPAASPPAPVKALDFLDAAPPVSVPVKAADFLDEPQDPGPGNIRLIAPPTEPDFVVDPQTNERLMTPPASFWQQIAGSPSPVSEPAQIPPEVAARVASVTPPLTPPQPAIGPLVQNIPQPSAQAKLMAKVGTGAGYDYLTKPLWDYLPEQLRSQLDAGQFADQVARKNPDDSFMQNVDGIINGLGAFGKSMTTPPMIAMMGTGSLPTAAQKLISAGFALQMASATPDLARQLGAEMGKPQDQQNKALIAELFTQGALNTGFSAFAGAHAIKPGVPMGPDFRGMTPEQKGAYGGEQTARLLAGKPLLPEPPVPAPNMASAEEFLQQRPTTDLSVQPRAPLAAGQAAAPPPATVTPPEAPQGTPARITTITQKFLDEIKAEMDRNQLAPAKPGEQPSSEPQAASPATVERSLPAQAPATPAGQAPPNDLTTTLDYSPEDLETYKTLKQRFTALSESEPGSEEWTRVWQDFENLRNKYNGNQPRQIVEANKTASGSDAGAGTQQGTKAAGVTISETNPNNAGTLPEAGAGVKAAVSATPSEADAYIASIKKNPQKQAYARAYTDWILGGKRGVEPVEPSNLTGAFLKATKLTVEESVKRDQPAAPLTGSDVDTTKEMFGREVRADKSGQQSLFAAGRSGKFQDAIGSFDETGDLKAVKNSGGDFLGHDANRVAGDNPWRYDAAAKTVGWWGDVPSVKHQDMVRAWLESRGMPVEHQAKFTAGGERPGLTPGENSSKVLEAINEKHKEIGRSNEGADTGWLRDIRGRAKSAFTRFYAKTSDVLGDASHDDAYAQTEHGKQLQSVAASRGAELVFYKGDRYAPKGAFHDGRLFANSTLPKDELTSIVEHELAHRQYELGNVTLRNLAGQVDLNSESAQTFRASYDRWLKQHGRPALTDAQAREELVADMVSGRDSYSDTSAAFKDPDKAVELAHEYHGVKMKEGGTRETATQFAAGKHKSQTDNRGTFDPNNPDIRFAAGDEEKPFDQLKSAADAANERRQKAYETLNAARDVSSKNVTPFKKWFGDSKVVDADGKPLEQWIDGRGDARTLRAAVAIAEIKEPMAEKDFGLTRKDGQKIWDAVRRVENKDDDLDNYTSQLTGRGSLYVFHNGEKVLRVSNHSSGSWSEWGTFAHDQKTPSIIMHKGEDYRDAAKRWLNEKFSSTQIKSATGNRGTFDPSNPDIRFAAGDEEKPFDQLKSAADAANERRQKAYETLNAARDVSSKNVTPEMQAERRAADMAAREANEALRRHPDYIADTITSYADALKQLEAAKAVGDPEKLAQARATAESFHDEFAQMPSRTFTQVWNRMQDEGKLPKSVELPPGRSLSNLTNWLRTAKIDSPKVPLMDRLRLSDRAAQLVQGAKDAVSVARTKAQAGWETLRDSMIKPPIDDDYRRIIKQWGYADNFTGQEGYDWTQRMKEKMPDPTRRAALSVWLDANGDEDEIRAQRADLQGVPSAAKHLRIWDTALHLTDTEKQIANSIQAEFESKLEDSKNVGILDKGRENYGVPQLWKKYPTMPESTGMGGDKAAANWRAKLDPRDPFFALQRTVPSYFEGIMHGGEPRTLDVMPLVDAYNQAFHKNITSRAVIWNLKDAEASDKMPCVKIGGGAQFLPLESGKRQLLVDSHSRPPGAVTAQGVPYKYLDHWALKGWTYQGSTEAGSPILVKGDFWVHPEIYDKLNNELNGTQWRQAKPTVVMRNGQPTVEMQRTAIGALGNTALQVSSFLKNSKMALGMFHLVNVGTHSVWNGVNPITSGFKLDLLDPKQAEGVRNGLELGFGNHQVEFQEGQSGAHGGLWSHVPGLGDLSNTMTDFIFKQAIPAMKMKNYLSLREGNEARYGKQLTPDQISELSAHQANAAFGLQNYRLLGSNKVLMDLNRMACLAPDFLASELKMGAQALTRYGGAQRRALVIQTAVMYTAARVINAALNNGNSHWEPENALSVIYNGRRYSIRSVAADLFGMVSNFPGFAAGRLGPLPKIGIESLTGRDMRTGANINTWTKFPPARATEIALREAAGWLAPIGTTGILPGAAKREETPLGSLASAQVGLSSRQYTAQSQMWDAAGKFNRSSPAPQAQLYQKDRDAEAHGEGAYRGLDNLLRAGDVSAAQKEYQALIEAGHKPSSISMRYNGNHPFTGNFQRDQQMLAAQPSLQPTYQQAMDERKNLATKFNQLQK